MYQRIVIILILAVGPQVWAQNHDDDETVNREIKATQVKKMGAEMAIPDPQELNASSSEDSTLGTPYQFKDARIREPRPLELDEYPHAELGGQSRKAVDPGQDINEVVAQRHLDQTNDQKYHEVQLDQIQSELNRNLKRAGIKDKINLRQEIKNQQNGDQ